MDFSIAEPLMLKYGISHDQIDELKQLAAKLPSDVIDGTRMPLPCIPGLSVFESELLMVRMLDAIAPTCGFASEWTELLDIAGYPSMVELMKVADRRPISRKVEAADLVDKPHLHA